VAGGGITTGAMPAVFFRWGTCTPGREKTDMRKPRLSFFTLFTLANGHRNPSIIITQNDAIVNEREKFCHRGNKISLFLKKTLAF
jgi:phage gp37-like protein